AWSCWPAAGTWPRRAVCQRRTVASGPAEASQRPSGESARPCTAPSGAAKAPAAPSPGSQVRVKPSFPAQTPNEAPGAPAPGAPAHDGSVTGEDARLAAVEPPDAHGLVVAPRREEPAVGREGERIDRGGVPAEDRAGPARRVPQLDDVCVIAGRERAAVGRGGKADEEARAVAELAPGAVGSPDPELVAADGRDLAVGERAERPRHVGRTGEDARF